MTFITLITGFCIGYVMTVVTHWQMTYMYTVNREIFVLKIFHAIIFRVKIILYASRPYENILRVQSTPPTCCPRAIILPRSTKKHPHSISTKPFEAATCSDGLHVCVQLYNSTTYSKKETNTMNFVFYTLTVVFSAQKKFISATVRLSPAESNSKGVFRRGLYHNVEFLLISTLAFCIPTLSTTKKIITMAMCRKTQRYGIRL